MNEYTNFAVELGNRVEIEINGYKGLINKHNLDVDIDGVMYMLSSTSAGVGIDREELIKMVESFE